MNLLRQALVVGAGNMGVGIAAHLAGEGVTVRLITRSVERRAAARLMMQTLAGEIAELYGTRAGGRVRAVPVEESAGTFRPDVVIEAIVELAAEKNALFARLERDHPGVPIWSTASSIVPSEMTAGLHSPQNVVVAHYANPAHLVPVVEVVPGPLTAPAVVEGCMSALRAWGKRPVLVRGEPSGFVFNRLQYAVMREAVHLVQQGVVSAEDLDAVVTQGYGLRLPVVGPLAMIDLSGLEVYARIARLVLPDLCNDHELPLLADMAARGRTFRCWSDPEEQDRLRQALRRELMDRRISRGGDEDRPRDTRHHTGDDER